MNDESTLDHYTAYISTDGQNLMSLSDIPVGTQSLDLSSFGFARGHVPGICESCGQAEHPEHHVGGGAYVVPPPTVRITSPYNGQHAGPYTNLKANASSQNGAITQYQVFVDGVWKMNLQGGPSFQAWVNTGMGNHTLTVKAEDSSQQWGNANVWVDRTY